MRYFFGEYKKVYFYPYIYAKATNNPLKSKKSTPIFPSRERWHSLENVYHSFLILHRRRMSGERKYYLMNADID